MDITELEAFRLNAARDYAMGDVRARYGDALGVDSMYAAASAADGEWWALDDEYQEIGVWRAGMVAGGVPVEGNS